jgi:hypothetical protein
VNIVVFRRARQFICGRISSKIILLWFLLSIMFGFHKKKV